MILAGILWNLEPQLLLTLALFCLGTDTDIGSSLDYRYLPSLAHGGVLCLDRAV